MSLTSSLFAGVSGLNSQGAVMGVLGDNIANISTPGFKAGQTIFSSLVTGASGASGGGSGSKASTRLQIDQQGLIQGTGVATDIAISGQGFFVVKSEDSTGSGDIFYTRAGSFRQDSRGNYVNAAGFTLQAWPLDNNGLLPGEIGNLNTTSSQLVESLQTVNTRDISGLAFASSTISLGINLDAGNAILAGQGDDLKPVSTLNSGAASADILIPTTGEIEDGDILNVSIGGATAIPFTYGGFATSGDPTASAILGATTTSANMTSLTNGNSFTINTTAAGGAITFTYQSSSPDTTAGSGEFNSLDTLATAISNTVGLEAIIKNNRLFVSSTDADDAVTFTNVAGGIPAALGAGTGGTIANGTAFPAAAGAAVDRFNTLDGLKVKVDAASGLSSTISSSSSSASINIRVDDPLQTVTFTSATSGTGDLMTEFGLTTGAQGPVYQATSTTKNMASGAISPAFSRNVRVFDSLGTGHDLRVSFVKAANNKWLVEVYAATASEVSTTNNDGLLASGTVDFNGDGTLKNVSSGLSNAIAVTWTGGSTASSITLSLGTAGSPIGTVGASVIGDTDGLSQFDGPFSVQFSDQNGSGAGSLTGIEVDEEGFIIANFSNSNSRKVFKIPISSFPNPNGLKALAGNVFSASDASGEFTLNEVGDSSVGKISVAALESANVELANELTKMIIAQRAFQSNTKLITTVDELLEELNRI